ncbi:MAG: hypothetical protein GXZ08_00615 [Tissierellia bacterium]|nr:hypothetical protein [Tissierellia bacterium]
MNNSIYDKKIREEFARQLLLIVNPVKYEESYLSDRPDIKNDALSIGVEVTSSIASEVHRFISRGRKFYKKSIVTSETNYISQNKIKYRRDNKNPVRSRWDSLSDIVKAYNRKYKSMQKEGYDIFEENNVFINAELASKSDIRDFIDFIGNRKITRKDFDYVYIYTRLFQMNLVFEIKLKPKHIKYLEITDEEIANTIKKTKDNVDNLF